MYRFCFFASLDMLDEYVAKLYSDGVSPIEIKQMQFHELKYWSKFHDLMQNEYKKINDRNKKNA